MKVGFVNINLLLYDASTTLNLSSITGIALWPGQLVCA
jgi:hypothetical protein